MKISESLDLVLETMILGLCFMIGLSSSISTLRKVSMSYEDLFVNKHTVTLGQTAEETEGVLLTYEEVILMVEVQDYQMPEPNEFTIYDGVNIVGVVGLGSKFREELVIYSNQLKGYLDSMGRDSNTRYIVGYALPYELGTNDHSTYYIKKVR